MMQVTLQGPAIIRAEELAAFLQMAGVPAVVTLCGDGATPEPMAVLPSEQAVVKDKPASRGRPRKDPGEPGKSVDPAATAQPVTNPVVAESAHQGGEVAEDKPHTPAAAAQDNADLQERFMAFVTADYDAALEMLQGFKVDRFSELPESALDSFGKKMAEAGF